jgi:hypothetical protein
MPGGLSHQHYFMGAQRVAAQADEVTFSDLCPHLFPGRAASGRQLADVGDLLRTR